MPYKSDAVRNAQVSEISFWHLCFVIKYPEEDSLSSDTSSENEYDSPNVFRKGAMNKNKYSGEYYE